MHQDGADRLDLSRALLRVRLASIALGVTLLVLAPRSDRTAAAAVLLGYAMVVVTGRFAPGRLALSHVVAVGGDILYATALAALLPPTVGSWALYAFAIGAAGLGSGLTGVAVATAAAILAYDLVLAGRGADLLPSDLWPVQALLAIGLLIAQLLRTARHKEQSRQRLRTVSLVQRDLAAARNERELLDRLTDHAVRSFGADSAWIEADGGGPDRHVHGIRSSDARSASASWTLCDEPSTRLVAAFRDGATATAAHWVIRDLVTDATPLLDATRERSRLEHVNATFERTLVTIRAIEHDTVANSVLADVLAAATAIAGPAALVRPADGTVVAGDLAPEAARALVRDTPTPSLVHGRADAPTAAVVSAGAGLALVVTGLTAEPTADDLRALALLGEIAAAATERIVERDRLVARGDALERRLAEVGQELQTRDDAVASAVHELRTPLTSVHAYAQLTSRNLQSVQQQVKQLDRLIGDLLRPSTAERALLDLDRVDVLAEARQAARRVRLVSGRTVNVDATGAGPFVIRADRGRVEQVIENLLNNAVKFSPQDQEVDVEVSGSDREVVLAVTDRGSGIPADELPRIFERHFRGAGQRDAVPGEGIGLAVAHEIVTAHGGRISASSDGPGTGSTFFVTLPVEQPVAGPQPLESPSGRRARDEASHQA